jgi:hypothetical protein
MLDYVIVNVTLSRNKEISQVITLIIIIIIINSKWVHTRWQCVRFNKVSTLQ